MKNLNLIIILIFQVMLIQSINAQDMNPKITTFLMFEGDAEEAVTFYTSLFDDSEILSNKPRSAMSSKTLRIFFNLQNQAL